MNSFELIEKYLPSAVDKYFAEDSKTAILEQGSKFIDVNFEETGYVKIASMLMDGLSDYYKVQEESGAYPDAASYAGNLGQGYRDGFQIGGTTLTWEIFKLQYVRGRQFRIDYISNEETAGIIIGNAVEEFNRLKVIPEVDACRFSLIADATSVSLGNRVAGDSVDASNIITKFNTAFEWLTNHEVPEEMQIIFVRPGVMTAIRNSSELTKFLTQGDYKSASGLTFTVEKFEGRPIIVVPGSRFFTDVLTTQNGYRPQSSSVAINFMVVSAKAVVPVRKLEWSKVYGPEQSGIAGFHGYLINYLLYHGLVIPKNKVPGIYASLSSTAGGAVASTLSVDTRAGGTQYYWKLNNFFTSPSGMRGTVYYSYSNAFSLGDAVTDVTGAAKCAMDEDIVATQLQTTAYFGLVDGSGKVIATTGASAVTLVRHA